MGLWPAASWMPNAIAIVHGMPDPPDRVSIVQDLFWVFINRARLGREMTRQKFPHLLHGADQCLGYRHGTQIGA